MPVDGHKAPVEPGISPEPYGSDTPVGSIEDASGGISNELYTDPLSPIVQAAMIQSARESGLIASPAPGTAYQANQYLKDDYVLESKITRFWVTRKSGPGGQAGPAWFTQADVEIGVIIYKPPFKIPFWQGVSAATYEDPPLDSSSASPEDETAIYDQPGEVLSVALTRSVAGIFNRTALHALIIEDQMIPRH
jgi:hypothetical protein